MTRYRAHLPIITFYLFLVLSTLTYAAWTTPRTWVTNELVTAALMNTHVRDNLIELRAGGLAITSQAAGDVLCASSTTQVGRIGAVATGQVLQSAGTSSCPGYTATLSTTVQDNITRVGAIATSGGQFAFPAAQVPSADANTLDDYEESTWTPVIGGSGGTSGQAYAAQTGTYTKVGRSVTAWFDATLSTEGTITGNAQIQGLPFTPASIGTCSIAYADNFTTVGPESALWTSGTAVTLYVASTTYTALTAANVTNTSRVVGVCHFNV